MGEQDRDFSATSMGVDWLELSISQKVVGIFIDEIDIGFWQDE